MSRNVARREFEFLREPCAQHCDASDLDFWIYRFKGKVPTLANLDADCALIHRPIAESLKPRRASSMQAVEGTEVMPGSLDLNVDRIHPIATGGTPMPTPADRSSRSGSGRTLLVALPLFCLLPPPEPSNGRSAACDREGPATPDIR